MEESEPEVLIEDEDYYFENGLMVLTSRYLLRRGYCCDQGCRNCPYEATDKQRSITDDKGFPRM